jgi:hypothetical protein
MRHNLFIFFCGVLILLIPTYIGAIHFANDLVPPFPDGDKGTIENHIVEGSTMYFKGKAAAMNLLAAGESGSKNLFEMSTSLYLTNTAIEYLEKAKINYTQALDIGKATGYVENRQDALINFDYDGFVLQNGLNPIIMKRVKAYLSKGDVTGFYMQIVIDIEGIIENLKSIKKDLERNVIPRPQVYWKLLQKFSETTLSGNYGTMVGITVYGG